MNKTQITLFSIIILLFAACSTPITPTQDQSSTQVKTGKPVVLTTFYPVEEITKAVVGNTADVKVLLGIGVEPHSFEPTPTQIVDLSKADVFVTMEGLFEHVEEDIIKANSNMKIIHSTHNVELIKGDEHDDHHDEHDSHEEEHHEDEEHMHEDEHNDEHDSHEDEHHEEEGHHDEHNHGEFDPHVWLSIHNMEKMTNEITEHLVELYPQNKELYKTNAQKYLEQLEQLEQEYSSKLAQCEHSEIIVNHKAFGYLGHEYGFEQVSVAGFSPESEPSPKTIQNVIDEAKEHNLKYIFSEGQIDSKTAQTIANDINGEVLELNPLRMNDNEDYFSIMRANLNNLALGLECQS